MAKKEISKNRLKHNFLKQTIIRIDYDYLFPNQIKKIMQQLDEYFGEKEFTIEEQIRNDFQVDISDQDINFNGEQESFNTFVNKENNISIEITKQYTALTCVYDNGYTDFITLKEMIEKVIEKIKEVRNYTKIKRVGIRKINAILLKDINELNNIFEKNLISNFIPNKETPIIKKEESYVVDDTNVDINTSVERGDLHNEDIYQIIFDINVSKEYPEEDNIPLEEMNNTIFNIFKEGITESFLEILTQEEFNDERVELKW